ncbi:MAG TPA: type II secretion system protein GspG [Gammaproteobacteria bacterium]
MAEVANMVCPNCNAFQPRAAVCDQCGVVIEKVLNTNKGFFEKKTVPADDKPKTNKLWLVLLIVCVIFYYSEKKDEEVEVVSAKGAVSGQADSKPLALAQEDAEPLVADIPDTTSISQQDRVITKLQTLKSTLYMLGVEGKVPPSNEEGLQSLVNGGLLTESDITDEWGNTFVYRLEWGEQVGPQQEYRIFVHSRGPDGISGNADDIAMP